MNEIIVIAELKELDFQNQPGEYTHTYSVRYVRMKNESLFRQLLQGNGLHELPSDAFILNESLDPKPLPLPAPLQMGYAAITEVEDAVKLAKAELGNPNSRVRRAGFQEATPIYFFMPGQKAEDVTSLYE